MEMNKKISEYRVVSANYPITLAEIVTNCIDARWQPFGSVSVSSAYQQCHPVGIKFIYVQAMVKYEDKNG